MKECQRKLEEGNLKVVIDGLLSVRNMDSVSFVNWMKEVTKEQTNNTLEELLQLRGRLVAALSEESIAIPIPRPTMTRELLDAIGLAIRLTIYAYGGQVYLEEFDGPNWSHVISLLQRRAAMAGFPDDFFTIFENSDEVVW